MSGRPREKDAPKWREIKQDGDWKTPSWFDNTEVICDFIKSYFKDMMGNMAMKTVTLANGFLNLAIKEKGEIRRDKIE